MKWCALLLGFLQFLHCSGLPLYQSDLASLADRALAVALADVNTRLAVSRLYRVTQASVSKAIPVGLNTYDLLISFGVKETSCLKSSREDPQSCAFRPGFFVSSSSCSTRVRASAELTQVLSLRCSDHSSSSESSSEEILRRNMQDTHTLVNRGPALTPPPLATGQAVRRQQVEIQPRGDTFSNYLL